MALLRNIITAAVGNEARKRGNGTGIIGFGLGVLAARIATRSIPGALLVGGALAVKALYDKSKDNEEAVPASDAVIDIEGRPVPTDITASGEKNSAAE